ncbi:mucin TcMUCII [Trypanosoma cruzi]|nr:mucin TcMUCII [Trypanosoma cruzi]
MTCRLLCALLVLALCCCPSVRGKASGEAQGSTLGHPPPPPPEQSRGTKSSGSNAPKVPEADRSVTVNAGGGSDVSSNTQDGIIVSGQPGSDGGIKNPPGLTDNPAQSVVKSLAQETGESKSNKGITVKTKTTTTTTTTTTTSAPTTTTTTAAPQAPCTTTTTEAPTTTTTRAPPHLREIDGSLSSSAWVCAPLLLAVSALACTAVG